MSQSEQPHLINHQTHASGELEASAVSVEMIELITELFPICRSITGEGVRETLRIAGKHIPLDLQEVPSGTPAFDWITPKEWNIRAAHIKDPAGNVIVDFKRSNLHVLNYSVPVHGRVSLKELKEHLYTLPERPDWIPYRTSYYKQNWGFCLPHKQLLELREGEYEVLIDASLEDGYLTYGEYFLKGKTDAEVLISTHVCHPSLANDNLSGLALSICLAKRLSNLSSRKYSYRFLFIPGTIGSITWLSLNESRVACIKHGLVLSGVGDPGTVTYKRSRRGDSEVDRVAIRVLHDAGDPFQVCEFWPYGYDERQFCSPGFNLPVGCFMRTPHGQYPEYHTSADDLGFVRPESLTDSFLKCWTIVQVLEHNGVYLNLNPKCEPQLGKRGLYADIGGQSDGKLRELAMLWVLNLSDGDHSLLDIAEKSHLKFDLIRQAAETLLKHNLLQEVSQ